MPLPFLQEYRARWSDMDFNQHMRNAAYLSASEDRRMSFLADRGFPVDELRKPAIGPVVVGDRLAYKNELRLLEPLSHLGFFEQLSLFDRNERVSAVVDTIRGRFGFAMVSLATAQRGQRGTARASQAASMRAAVSGSCPRSHTVHSAAVTSKGAASPPSRNG